MITIFKSNGTQLVTHDQVVPDCWIHVVNPDQAEIERLKQEFHIPESFITASLDLDELARIDKENEHTLIIVLIPYIFSEDPNGVPYNTAPLGIINTKEYLFTICRVQTNIISDFTKKQAQNISTAKRNRLILQLFFAIAQSYLAYLRQITNKTDAIERKVQVSIKNKALLDLLRYQKSLIYFLTSLESNTLMMSTLQRIQFFEMFPDDLELLEDVLTENKQAREVTKISSDILNQMMDAYASIISNNLNDVMKILAIATIILSIPTVIASIYGMNVLLPGQESEYAFTAIVFVSVLIILIATFIFWRRRWF